MISTTNYSVIDYRYSFNDDGINLTNVLSDPSVPSVRAISEPTTSITATPSDSVFIVSSAFDTTAWGNQGFEPDEASGTLSTIPLVTVPRGVTFVLLDTATPLEVTLVVLETRLLHGLITDGTVVDGGTHILGHTSTPIFSLDAHRFLVFGTSEVLTIIGSPTMLHCFLHHGVFAHALSVDTHRHHVGGSRVVTRWTIVDGVTPVHGGFQEGSGGTGTFSLGSTETVFSMWTLFAIHGFLAFHAFTFSHSSDKFAYWDHTASTALDSNTVLGDLALINLANEVHHEGVEFHVHLSLGLSLIVFTDALAFSIGGAHTFQSLFFTEGAFVLHLALDTHAFLNSSNHLAHWHLSGGASLSHTVSRGVAHHFLSLRDDVEFSDSDVHGFFS